MDTRSLLSRSSVFGHLGEPQISWLLAEGESHQYGSGEWIVHHGDVWPYLFLVGSGSVQALKESLEGRSLALASLSCGDLFWGLAFFVEDAPMPAALLASEDCELCLWARRRIMPMLLHDGRIAWELSRLLVQRVQLASEIVDRLAFQPVAGRLAALLLQQYGEQAHGPMARGLTLDEMAARVGSTREVVSRFLHRFSDQGVIEITRTEFTVRDAKRLQDLSRQSKG